MKQLLVLLLLLLCSMSVSAQDVIVKKDGSTVVCRVVEVTATEITYKKWSDLNGSNYVMDKSLASAINYESGKKDTFSQTESLYKPNNQNDGEQAMNDKALLRLDAAENNPYKKVKVMRVAGCVIGAMATGVAIYALIDNGGDSDIVVASSLLGGAAVTSGLLVTANLYKRHYQNKYRITTMYQYDIPFSNGSSLSLGADILNDLTLGTNTVGLGLRYNF